MPGTATYIIALALIMGGSMQERIVYVPYVDRLGEVYAFDSLAECSRFAPFVLVKFGFNPELPHPDVVCLPVVAVPDAMR